MWWQSIFYFFFFNDTATTEIYTSFPTRRSSDLRAGARSIRRLAGARSLAVGDRVGAEPSRQLDRKSTRLNSSHSQISYAVFCLKKKNIQIMPTRLRTHVRYCMFLTPVPHY